MAIERQLSRCERLQDGPMNPMPESWREIPDMQRAQGLFPVSDANPCELPSSPVCARRMGNRRTAGRRSLQILDVCGERRGLRRLTGHWRVPRLRNVVSRAPACRALVACRAEPLLLGHHSIRRSVRKQLKQTAHQQSPRFQIFRPTDDFRCVLVSRCRGPRRQVRDKMSGCPLCIPLQFCSARLWRRTSILLLRVYEGVNQW
jgi:hypothetical protein